jgi:hypothetical protein
VRAPIGVHAIGRAPGMKSIERTICIRLELTGGICFFERMFPDLRHAQQQCRLLLIGAEPVFYMPEAVDDSGQDRVV